MKKVWFITGCSTGFGHALAKELLENGYRVAVTARNVEQIKDREKVLIHTKFNNYYNIMYNNKIRYTELWNKKNIYTNNNLKYY